MKGNDDGASPELLVFGSQHDHQSVEEEGNNNDEDVASCQDAPHSGGQNCGERQHKWTIEAPCYAGKGLVVR